MLWVFFVSDLKIVYNNNYQFSITMTWTREENYFASQLLWRQNHSELSQNRCSPIFMIMIYNWDKKLKKWLPILKADIITIKKNIDLMSLAQRMHFLQEVFQMTAIALISMINHYHTDGFYLFWDTIYIYIYIYIYISFYLCMCVCVFSCVFKLSHLR